MMGGASSGTMMGSGAGMDTPAMQQNMQQMHPGGMPGGSGGGMMGGGSGTPGTTTPGSMPGTTMPGTMTPTEMVQAAELGADYIKIFPIQSLGGPQYVANVRRALPQLPLVPTGNIDLAEIPAYDAAGVAGYGIGAPLIRSDLVERRDRDAVVANVKRFLEATRRR